MVSAKWSLDCRVAFAPRNDKGGEGMWVDMGALPNRFAGLPRRDDVPPRNDKGVDLAD